ncbi:TPA: efflux RND transporter periplasmic adaptor subunit [Streptococcus pyogenes]|nr:efflux RND transporter periplasmic adaptor subunit [Streptococcus pyogenes]HER2618563.1 efflux RND transporter periplasmic adaptor subunit [Streptococcus pyogenes]HER2626892.1 efflux RND transporter periplasmic adaptor subunit [Streptococcus pyogenes]
MFQLRKKMTRKQLALLSAGVLTCVVGGTYLIMNHQQQEIVSSVNKVKALTIKEAMEQGKDISLTLAGEVTANNSSKVKIDSSKGEVKDVFVKKGDVVKVGQPLFSYETSQRLTAQSSEFDVQTKANQLQVAKTNAALKWETYNRKVNEINTLKSRYNTAPDESLLEQIRSAEDSVSQALSDAKTADSDVKTAQIELDKANATATMEKGKLEYDTVKSDTAGTIVSLNTDLPNQSKSKKENETFMEIIDKSKMLVKGNISEFDRDKLKIGQKVEVIDRKDNSKKWTGKVTQVGNLKAEEKGQGQGQGGNDQQDNPNQAKFPYVIELDQSDKQPLIGSHTYVNVLNNVPEAGKIVLKETFTMAENGKTYVWKVDKNKVKKQEVKTKSFSKGYIEVTSGLTMQDKIAQPLPGMKDGMEVGSIVKP